MPAAMAAERSVPRATPGPEPTAAAEAGRSPAAGVLVKQPAVAVEPAPAAEPPPSSDAATAWRRSSRKRDGRIGDGDQTKDQATAAAQAAPTLPQRVTSQPVGRPNRAGKLSVDDF
jgi:hypothetical protein